MSDPNWLKEPDESGDAVVYVSIPEGSQLTPDITEALTRLGNALHDLGKETLEVNKPCTGLHSCNPNKCQPLHSRQCFVYVTCKVRQ
jgi:hypothetical protein